MTSAVQEVGRNGILSSPNFPSPWHACRDRQIHAKGSELQGGFGNRVQCPVGAMQDLLILVD